MFFFFFFLSFTLKTCFQGSMNSLLRWPGKVQSISFCLWWPTEPSTFGPCLPELSALGQSLSVSTFSGLHALMSAFRYCICIQCLLSSGSPNCQFSSWLDSWPIKSPQWLFFLLPSSKSPGKIPPLLLCIPCIHFPNAHLTYLSTWRLQRTHAWSFCAPYANPCTHL